MAQYYFYLYLFSILHLLSTINYVHGFNEPNDNQQKNRMITLEQHIQTIYFVFIILCIGIISLYCILYYQIKQKNKTSSVSKKSPTMKTNMNRNLNELYQFKPIKPCVLSYIHRAQAQFVLDELITEAKKTKLFTIVPNIGSLHANYMFIHIELVQDSQTIIALIEYIKEIDVNSSYYRTLRQFFTIIFDSSKTIQTWGKPIDQLMHYTRYGLFACSDISQAQLIDVQKQFKPWYNNLFRHNVQCHQYLKYDHTDGSLCTCAHRPYKSPSYQWSISKAIAYTFDERYDHYMFDIHKCLAITKLGCAIAGKRTSPKSIIYKPEQHINEKAKE